MSNPSNLYAEKVYSEHPTILWALDDQADYISLITEEQRDLTDWTTTNGSATSFAGAIGEPFLDSITTQIEGDATVSTSLSVSTVSPDLINFSNLNTDLGSFSIGAYFYSDGADLESVSIGFEYTDTTTATVVQKLETFPTNIFQAWSFVSSTFEIPNENTEFRIVLKFTYLDGTGNFYVNGVTAGQWSEEFNATSLGVSTISIPANISIATTSGIAADAYGLSGDPAYYLVNDSALLARNSGVPMVYGASGITKLTPNINNEPSLIVPGYGFLNQVGQFKDYTVEFWARINSNSSTPKRIFGPINSNNGIYVDGGFLTLVIGKEFSSHFVGEWFRPMLIHVRLIRNNATVLLNGEEIINLPIDTDNLDLPAEVDESEDNQDWLGFYAYEDVSPIEIDCVGIYPYSVAINVAKRRWVYGQGVLSPEAINSGYGGTQAFIDYPFADYTANYNYPDFAQWDQGTFDNLISTNTSLSTPDYSLPEIFIDTKTLQELYADNQEIQDPEDENFITFRPNNTWNSDECYFNFSRFNILNNQINAIYGIFSSDDLASEEILFKIYSPLTGNYFLIVKDADEIIYSLTFNGQTEAIYTTDAIISDQKFAVGIRIQTLISFFGGNVATFFGNQNGLKIYCAGDETGTYQFTGKIYSIGILTAYNASEILDHFEDNGTIIVSGSETALLEHTASYTLLPTEAYGSYFLDIGVSGYWEDYLPLSYFAQFVTNDSGNEFYDLDFLQFNIGYPSPTKLSESETTSSWNYGQLQDAYSSPIQQTYAQLGNSLYTGYNNYEDMQENAVKYFEYDTTGASIKSYITFQYIKTGANSPQSNFTITEPAKENKIIDINDYPDWTSTKFEVVDNTLIYPTKTIDFNELAIVYHLNFDIRGILKKPVGLRRLELASQAFNDNSFNPVGTRFGVELFPFKRSGLYYDYKSKNPFSIYKGSTPYLYLTRSSGIEVRGDFNSQVNRGLALPINPNLADEYRISATQFWMRSDLDQFPLIPTEIFEIKYKTDTIKFYMVATNESGSRAKVFAKSQLTNTVYNGLTYFWNGALVREPTLTVKEWGVMGISFGTALNFDLFLGGINLTGPILFNNISYYQKNSLQQIQSSALRPWSRVITNGTLNFEWEDWFNSFTWEGVLIIDSSDLYGVNPSDVYKTYIGTNKIIIDDEEGMIFDADKLKIYNDTTWVSSIGSAV